MLLLLVALGLTVFGSGTATRVVVAEDTDTWLYSASRGEVARVSAVTARVDTRARIPGARGHLGQLAQTSRYLIMRDENTGDVSALDLTTLTVSARTATAPGRGVRVVLTGDAALVVDTVQGIVRQYDPVSLTAVGGALRFPPGLTGGVVDGTGQVWLAAAGEGTVVAVRPAPAPGAAATPTVARTVAVADPGHDLALTALDDGVAALDRTTGRLTVVRRDVRYVDLPDGPPALLPERVTGADVPVTVPDTHTVYLVHDGQVRTVPLPPGALQPGPAVAFDGRLYCPDPGSGALWAIRPGDASYRRIATPTGGGPLEVQVRGQHLVVNAPRAARAAVVDAGGQVHPVDKYADGIPGGDPLREPANPPPPPPKPRVSVPGAPPRVSATAGTGSARVTWDPAAPHGAPVTRYVVRIAGRTLQAGTGQRALTVTGLRNGATYRFRVAAVNRIGTGPESVSDPVVPTSDVPAAPAPPAAVAHPDGTVRLAWSPADGLGRRIVRYTVTAVTPYGPVPAGTATGTALTVPAGALPYGTQVAFTVSAVNDIGAASPASPPSPTVVPYTVPAAPAALRAVPDTTRPGTVRVAWDAADEHGSALTGYQVTVGDRRFTAHTTGATVDGLGDGVTVAVSVAATNAAGAGPAATATTRTITGPKLTLTGTPTVTPNSLSVTVSVDSGGSPTTCTLAVTGGPGVSGGCTRLATAGLWPATTYRYTVTARNAAGSAAASGSARTPAVYGTVVCPDNVGGYCNTGVWAYRTPSQSGTAVDPPLRVGSTYQARCWRAGGTVDARPWGGRRSAVWLRRGTGDWFPWAWTRLDGRDDYREVPPC